MTILKPGYIYPAKPWAKHSDEFNHYKISFLVEMDTCEGCYIIPYNSLGETAPGYADGIPKYTSYFYVTKGFKEA